MVAENTMQAAKWGKQSTRYKIIKEKHFKEVWNREVEAYAMQ